jgi:hypothetical protein
LGTTLTRGGSIGRRARRSGAPLGREPAGQLLELPRPLHHPLQPGRLCSAAGDQLAGYRRWTDRADVEAIAKPFDIGELLEAVDRLLTGGRDCR